MPGLHAINSLTRLAAYVIAWYADLFCM